jgi:uncharacterized protein (TIGR04255 family)
VFEPMIGSETTIAIDAETPIPHRPADFPNFERPPINEVALSFQFAPLPKFRSAYVGLLWQRLRSEYPKASEQPALLPSFETFPTPDPLPFQFAPFSLPPMPRFWFEESDGAHLLQIQQDRIVHNWRKREAEQDYPRYEVIRERFEKDLDRFVDFLRAEDLGEVRPNQCEVTYINAIEISKDTSVYQQLEQITPLWGGHLPKSFSLEPETATLQSSFVLRDAEKPFGRAHVTFAPGILTTENRPILRLEITVRARPSNDSITESFRLLDAERELVVRTFAAVTTPAMWEIWGRTDAK